MSALLRRALRAEAEKRRPRKTRSADELGAILDRLYGEHPGPPPEYVRLGVDAADRRQARAYVRQRAARQRDGDGDGDGGSNGR